MGFRIKRGAGREHADDAKGLHTAFKVRSIVLLPIGLYLDKRKGLIVHE